MKKNEAFLPKNTVPTLKHGGSLKMILDCFSSRGSEQLIAIRGIMKSEDYIKILDENLQLSAQNLNLVQWFSFQPDNDPKHTSKSVTACLQKKKITVQAWPSMIVLVWFYGISTIFFCYLIPNPLYTYILNINDL